MLEETGSSPARVIAVGEILAAVQGGSRAGRYFRDAPRAAVLEHLLTGDVPGAWTVADGTKLLDVLRLLRDREVSAAEMLIRDDPERARLLERGYAVGRDQYEAAPPFTEAGIGRILELLATHFPRGIELDGMIAAIEARVADGMAPYFTSKLEGLERSERWEAHYFRLMRLRERVETFLREVLGDKTTKKPVLPFTPALAQLFEGLAAAECRAAECPTRPQADPYLFRASTEYQSGRHDTFRTVASYEYEPSAEEARCLPANGQRVRAFRLRPQFGLLTLTDVHFRLQRSVLKGAGFMPRLGVDYVLRVASAKEVKVLSRNPAVIKRLLACRVNMQVRTGAPYRCVSTGGMDLLDNLGRPRCSRA